MKISPYKFLLLITGSIFAFGLVVFAQQGFAWTNPSSNPPLSINAINVSGGNVGIGTATPDANYRLTTSGGGIKAENNSATQPAGYFNNAGGGPAITVGTGGLTLGGVNRTTWGSGDNLGNHTATAALNMSGNDITALRNLTLSGTMTPNGVGFDSGLTGDRAYQFGYQEGGAWAFPYPDLIFGYHTGVKIGGYYSYGGTRFYNDHPSRAGATEILSVGNGDNHVRVANNLYVTGNVGIGTSAPAVKLHVNGSVRGDQAGALRIDSGSGVLDIGAMNAGYAHFQTDRPSFYLNKTTAIDGALTNYSNAYHLAQSGVSYLNGGNIGIGTTDPTSQMAGTQGIGIFKNNYPAIGFKNDSSSWLWYASGVTFRLWNASAGDLLTANTSGNVGIGTITPAQKLDVNGYIKGSGLCIGTDCKTAWNQVVVVPVATASTTCITPNYCITPVTDIIYNLAAVPNTLRSQNTPGTTNESNVICLSVNYCIVAATNKIYLLDAATNAIRSQNTSGTVGKSKIICLSTNYCVSTGTDIIYTLDAVTNILRSQPAPGVSATSPFTCSTVNYCVILGTNKTYVYDAQVNTLRSQNTPGT